MNTVPVGAVTLVQEFTQALADQRWDDAGSMCLEGDPDIPLAELAAVLDPLVDQPGAGITNERRITKENDDIVRMVFPDEVLEHVEGSTEPPSIDFIVRRTSDGWRIVQIVIHLNPVAAETETGQAQ
jgi:hypothetical protein